MTDQPKKNEIEAVVRQVEEAIKAGRTDSELDSSREVRQMAIDALIKSEYIDPEKLPININI